PRETQICLSFINGESTQRFIKRATRHQQISFQVKSRTFPKMETGEVISTDKGTVVRLKVTQDNVMFVDGQETEGKDQNTVLEGFLKLQPKALGTVQVMIGAMVFFLGVLLTINDYNYPAILVYSGITYWGSWIVKASLGMNVFSAITAGLAILLMSIQLGIISMMDPSLYAEFIISICISAFACKATCNQDSTLVNVALN
ncbi:hypothetical protein PO909_011157, partial [Leuciscus waleckii]